jgi:hypothetical protein
MPRTLFTILIIAAGLTSSAPAFADDSSCPELVLSFALRGAAERAETAFGATRVEDFQGAILEIDQALPCLMDPVDPELAAFIHRMKGLGAFIERDQDRARQAFASARSLQPDYAWPETLIPWGHPLLALYEALPIDDASYETVPMPAAGWVYMDGRPSEPRPREWPTILQVSDAEGAVQLSSYLWPSDALPAYGDKVPAPIAAEVPAVEARELPVTVAATSTTVHTGPRPWLVATAGGAAVASGVLYALAARSHEQYQDPATPFDDLDAARSRTNGLVLASAGAAGLALGTGVGAFISLQW